MATERRWQFALFKRVLANMFAGALLAALIGALCGAMLGVFAQWILIADNASLGFANPPAYIEHFVISVGGSGAVLGILVGAFIFAAAAVRARPGRIFEPLREFAWRVMLGLSIGAVGFCSLFLVVEWARAALFSQTFHSVARNDLTLLFRGVPILMICGAVAGALSVCGQQPRREA